VCFVETVIVVLAKISHKYRPIFGKEFDVISLQRCTTWRPGLYDFSHFVFFNVCFFLLESKIAIITHIFLNQRIYVVFQFFDLTITYIPKAWPSVEATTFNFVCCVLVLTNTSKSLFNLQYARKFCVTLMHVTGSSNLEKNNLKTLQ
jgi:hypothetical protein